MNNDLISREGLKEKAETVTLWNGDVRRFVSYETIDNAPTVEPFEPDYVGAERLKARQRGYNEGYHKGMEIGKSLNPKIKHGKWKFNTIIWLCSVCNQPPHTIGYCGTETFMNEYFRFCPNCGADMRGEDHD